MGQLDRNALNQAFWDLGLRFQWDEATWAALAVLPDLRAQLSEYLGKHQPHLLAVYDVDFLRTLIEQSLVSPRASMGIEAHRSV
jgi:hypothetical protein